jgi:predicted small lipoprotein YifL
MARVFPALLVIMALSVAGCGPKASQAKPPSGTEKPAASAGAKETYICHMGADCGMSQVGPGDKIPSCCGKVMVKADTFTCPSCGKPKIVAADKGTPECCGAAMKKVQP